jgi:hypothetical protein
VIGAVVGGGRDHAAAVGIPATRPGRPDRRRSQTALFTHVSESADDQSQTLVMDESRVPGPPRHARIRPRGDREAASASDARNSSSSVVCDASAEMTACDEKAQVRKGIEGSSETVEPSRGQRERYPGWSLVGHARASWSPTRMPATRSEITGWLPLGCGDGAQNGSSASSIGRHDRGRAVWVGLASRRPCSARATRRAAILNAAAPVVEKLRWSLVLRAACVASPAA